MSTAVRQTRIITFYAAQEGAGRTMALANIAWIMASRGKSVLVIDWDLENPGLHLYYAKYLTDPDLTTSQGVLDMFSGFAGVAADQDLPAVDLRALRSEHAAFGNLDVDIRYDFPDGGRLCYIGPGQTEGGDYAGRRNAFDWRRFHTTQEGQEFLAALRHRMTLSGYDYILIDGRSGTAEGADICTLALPDAVVLGINLNQQSVDGARGMARLVFDHPRRIGLHVLPLRVDNTTDSTRVERAIAHARAVLDPYLDITDEEALEAYWKDVRLPYQAELSFGEELAVMTQDPHLPHTFLHACVRAAARITEGAVDCFRLAPREERDEYASWRAHTEQRVTPVTVTLLNHPDDQLWADWVGEQLAAAGVKVQPEPRECVLFPDGAGANSVDQGPDTDYVIALLSQRLERSVVGDRIAALAMDDPSGRPARPRLIGLRVSTAPLSTHFDWTDAVNLAGQSERAAHHALFSRFAREIGTPAFVPAERTRFPGAQPPVTNLPMRNSRFVGRSRQLSALHAAFAFSPAEHIAPRVLSGMMGVGKYQTSLEYAHRYASQYDVVWLIPATSSDSIRAELRALAEELNSALGGARSGDDLPALLRDLRTGRYYSRWLLLFDGADSSAVVQPFLPTIGPGHVLITSRTPDWPDGYQVQQLDSFTPEESLHLLEGGLRGAPTDALERLAERLGHHPFMLNGAVAELSTYPSQTDNYIARLDSLEAGERSRTLPGYRTLDTVHREIYEGLKRQSPAAARLLELCSFLAPDGVSMMVVESKGMTNLLTGLDPGLRDELRVRAVVHEIALASLAVEDQTTERLKVPRVIQDLVRSWLEPEERDRTQQEVLAVLAAMVPSDLTRHEPRHRATFDELDRHLEPSGALASSDQNVHRWLVSQVYHRRTSARWSEAAALGERILTRWREELGESRPEVLRMESEVASACRELGRYQDALSLSGHAYNTLSTQNSKDVYTLMAARGYAAALRASGLFDKAFEQDQATHRGLVRAIGPEHNATLDASNNLALSKFYMETVEAALALDRETYTLRLRKLGQDDFRPWLSYANLGMYCRELGDLESSERYLARACGRLREITGKDSPYSLDALASLGMTMVRKGEIQGGRQRIQDARAGLRRQWGDRYARSMACEVALAIGMHASGLLYDAVTVTQEVYDRYVEMFGEDHPFTNICLNNMAVYLLASEGPEVALPTVQRALYRLGTVFRPGHRYLLAARLNQSNCLHVSGRDTSGEDIGIYEDCRKPTAWGEKHPVTLIALANRLTSAPEGERGALRAILVDGVSELPEEHPLRVSLLATPYRRMGVDLEVQDV
ncbi:FxSxx-COOH system tetratricopeptide repeat protein [Streptomyces sp. NPDC002766]|uniref:FxSxx-COOH system tetratricopeptide repeat protein n=1 Tax=Streptomyces sp. NPDC002766 TaxID=3154429 RepID=UPI0033178338